MSDVEHLIRRIAALKRLAEGAGTPAEAAAAAAKAQQLMFAHNIEEAHLDARAATADDLYVDERGIEAVGVWRQRLIAGIARTNFCRTVYSVGGPGGGRTTIALVGRRENIDHVLGLWRWLVLELEHMATRARSDVTAGGESVRTWKNSYYHGAVGAILDRLRAQRAADEKGHDGASTALVVVEKGLDTALDRFYPNCTVKRLGGSARLSSGGYGAGRRDGSAMALDRIERIA
jgi:Protein of unknown function (DUF2786)